MYRSYVICLVSILCCVKAFSWEENFLLVDGATDQVLCELGPHLDERITPCSTFKIVLSLMGYDVGILNDEQTPTWEYQEGYADFLDSWKAPQTPSSWMKNSCLWYSQLLATRLGEDTLQHYLRLLDYGNADLSGGLMRAWLSSSLEISPREQVRLLCGMVRCELPLSNEAVHMTKRILALDTLPQEWKLFGKTGWSGSERKPDGKQELGWFIGWIEKDPFCFPFAYTVRDTRISLGQRIPRVIELLIQSGVMYAQDPSGE